MSWEEGDILLRLESMAGGEEMRSAFDWYHRSYPGHGMRPAAPIALDAAEYPLFLRLVGFGEIVGLLVRRGLVREELAHDRWMLRGPWSWLRLTVEQERSRFGPGFAQNFEWIAGRDAKRSERSRRHA